MAWTRSSGRLYRLVVSSPSNRRIMTTPFRAENYVEDLQKNPYFEKYSKKIANLQKTSPEEFLSRLVEQHEKKTNPKAGPGSHKTRDFSSVSSPKQNISHPDSPTYTKQKSLDSVMKMELIADKTCDEIKQIWEEYHKQKDVIAATISSSAYDIIYEKSVKYPIFLFPLPRDKGYEFILCQFEGHEIHFTPLINYQAHKENSPECLTMTHYIDLKDKGLVLMRGEYNKDVLNGSEVQCLANQLQLYYGEDNEKRTKLLERFTFTPQEFKHMDLIAELENLSL
ncbi:hypothetical protein C0J52_01263 [Blattella germanica]|nr:hypothetical protein C0J52_01263 [Blattella germanica]